MIAPMIAPTANAQTTKRRTTKTTSSSQPAPAKKSLHDQLSGQGYGLAGCGLGSIAFGPKPGAIQIVAATLNGTGMQTFGITTGTSNCDIPTMGQQAAVFIEVNREILAKDASRGQGETIENLAAILNCSDAAAFGQGLQGNFGEIFKKENNSYDATRAILATIKSTPALQSTCHVG